MARFGLRQLAHRKASRRCSTARKSRTASSSYPLATPALSPRLRAPRRWSLPRLVPIAPPSVARTGGVGPTRRRLLQPCPARRDLFHAGIRARKAADHAVGGRRKAHALAASGPSGRRRSADKRLDERSRSRRTAMPLHHQLAQNECDSLPSEVGVVPQAGPGCRRGIHRHASDTHCRPRLGSAGCRSPGRHGEHPSFRRKTGSNRNENDHGGVGGVGGRCRALTLFDATPSDAAVKGRSVSRSVQAPSRVVQPRVLQAGRQVNKFAKQGPSTTFVKKGPVDSLVKKGALDYLREEGHLVPTS